VSKAALAAGILLAALADAIAGTALSLGRGDILGATHATPDELAWLDVGYTAPKLIGFIVAAWMLDRFDPKRLLFGVTLALGAACALAAITVRLDWLITLRIVQGFSGGVLLVAGQTLLFMAWSRGRQPLLQALFAIGSVVATASLAPALQGWLVDQRSWTWIFWGTVPIALSAAGLLWVAQAPTTTTGDVRIPLDWIGLSLLSIAFACITYVLIQGSRWAWFEAPHIGWTTSIGVMALLAFTARQSMANGMPLLRFTTFHSSDFTFAFLVSFVAGAALFGSAFVIPAFATSVLSFTPTEAGRLLLWGSAPFIAALLLAAWLVQARRMPPFGTVPFGILAIVVAMWMLSGSNGESGLRDMSAGVALRGVGLGFLFLSITLIAFGELPIRDLPCGIGLFNAGRQLGGLMGVAGLQTLIEREVADNLSVLGAGLSAGIPAVSERLAGLTSILVARGMETEAAGRAAFGLLNRAASGQSAVIAFQTAFNAVALLLLVAAPVLLAVKRVTKRIVPPS
jgi:DHA2 family multidrug resistance protein